MDVAAWLQSLGLARYGQVFRENRIDADVLPRLTVEDLKDLGVTFVGDRRRLIDAISALGGAVPVAAGCGQIKDVHHALPYRLALKCLADGNGLGERPGAVVHCSRQLL